VPAEAVVLFDGMLNGMLNGMLSGPEEPGWRAKICRP